MPTPLAPEMPSARGGDARADWMPRAALASGPSEELFIDSAPLTGRLPRSPAAGSAPLSSRRGPTERAEEKTRLKGLVQQFTREAAAGRACSVVVLDNCAAGKQQRPCATPREARYELRDEAGRLVVELRDCNAASGWIPLGAWPLAVVLGAHRAEDSLLAQSALYWHRGRGDCADAEGGAGSIDAELSHEVLSRSAVLEFGGGACALRAPLLLVEASVDHRERLVAGLQVLRLYWSARHSGGAASTSGGGGGGRASGGPGEAPVGSSGAGCGGRGSTSGSGGGGGGGIVSTRGVRGAPVRLAASDEPPPPPPATPPASEAALHSACAATGAASSAAGSSCSWSPPVSPVSATVSPMRPPPRQS